LILFWICLLYRKSHVPAYYITLFNKFGSNILNISMLMTLIFIYNKLNNKKWIKQSFKTISLSYAECQYLKMLVNV